MNGDFAQSVGEAIRHTEAYGSDQQFRRKWLGFSEESRDLRAQQIRVFGALLSEITSTLHGWRILDVGCGDGTWLRTFLEYDANPKDIVGVDISDVRFPIGYDKNPLVEMKTYNGINLPFEDNTFDLVTQFVAFSNIPSSALRKHIGCEIARVIKPAGYVFWWDLPKTTAPTDAQRVLAPEDYFKWPIRKLEIANRQRPSETLRPLRGTRDVLGWFFDKLGYKPSHIAALIGPKPHTPIPLN